MIEKVALVMNLNAGKHRLRFNMRKIKFDFLSLEESHLRYPDP